MKMKKLGRLIAFYLPQYHPIRENDNYWGRGFTEWTNVAKAKPMFHGHYQPHVPADLGFYDLRLPEVRVEQAELAREHGIEAFCYYHYWFAGKRVLERPFEEVLKSREPDFPFCLCWANETWTGIWHGNLDEVLVEQTYPGFDDHEMHFYELLKAFEDKRYVTVNGKPILLIYRPHKIPDIERVIDFWRELAAKVGLKGLYMAATSWSPSFSQQHCFDAFAAPNFPPIRAEVWVSKRNPLKYFIKGFQGRIGKPTVYSYKKVMLKLLSNNVPNVENHPCLVPNWDNTPRCGANGLVLHGSTPELFRVQVKEAIEMVQDKCMEEKLIFVKSWNEWAEGNHLEPDLKFGRAYLRVIADEIFKNV